jgi:ABC-type multidrug transport system fused ATPase/permease subunit
MLNIRRDIKIRLAMQEPIIQKHARLEFKHLETPKTVDLLNRAGGNPHKTIGEMEQNVVDFFRLVGTVSSYIVILLINAPVTGIALIMVSIPFFWLANKAGKATYQAYKEATVDQRYSGSFSWNMTSRYRAAERNLFGWSRHINTLYLKHYELARKHQLKTEMQWYLRNRISPIILWALAAAGLFMMAPNVASGTLSVGLFISLQGVLLMTVNWMGWSLPWHFQQFTRHREWLKEFNQFLALSDVKDAEVLPASPPPVFESLEFKDVTFSYPGMEKTVLKNLSLSIEPGKHYAFVGVNGAGKTTLTKLLTRLYDDYTGEILLNGKDIRQHPMADVKAAFCALFQDFARYDISVSENVAMGKINGASAEEVDNALTLAGFDEKAEELKNGIHTLLGKTHEDGIELSGGQWQRLAFARAIVSPAPVKILDEPTASLDPVAERTMYAQFEQISRGFTTIFISHRLASAKMADTIFVLEDGTITEQGNHDALMAKKGVYAGMYETQQSWYL